MPEILATLANVELNVEQFTNKSKLKAGIKKIFVDDALKNKANISEIDGTIDSLAERLTNVIDLYVKNELARMKEALVAPGAYTTITPSLEVVAVTPGTIKNYQP